LAFSHTALIRAEPNHDGDEGEVDLRRLWYNA